jgi:signal transduction histidine kinase
MILHFSGGIENPFYLYFIFHTIFAGVLLSKTQSYVQATIAVVLFVSLILLEYFQIIPHYVLAGFANGTDYRNEVYIFGTIFVFATTIYAVAYLTDSISEQLRQQQEKLAEINAELEKKDNLKNEYVLRLTHDKKGHLAAIQSCLDVVQNRLAGPLNEKQADMVERAHRRTDKCLNFISALLKITRMKLTGQLDMEYFPLRDVIFDSLAAVERKAKDKGITISHLIDEGIDEIYGEQVLIEVKDNGIGIPQADLPHIFEEFYRAENARKIEKDGTGLGLSFARQVVERHNGRIWASNNAEGGSTFNIWLPKLTAEA